MMLTMLFQKWELRHCDIKLSKVLGHGAYGEVRTLHYCSGYSCFAFRFSKEK